MKIRVILADDHPLIIFGVKQTLATMMGVEVVAEASNSRQLMEKLETVPTDVLITDFSMPMENSPDGLVMLNAIRVKQPGVKVLVLTMLENPGLLVSMRDSGVRGILNKRDDISELPAAVLAAYQGRTFFGTAVRREIEQAESGVVSSNPERSLSPRELEVVRLYVNGMTMTEVARHLHRSVNTVSTQKGSAMRKLGLSSDAALFDYAVEHGMRG
ncbi:two component transcriptional regulator, LuxR family [Cupriavidus sp. YR651]|uniref:response regulator transcription factor n=1 Tax=Cupriavidus sp. YR651 TaxID=1855315 RepID=UPI00088E5AA6|nr:response regulator transcription factor [Cupriavidus sp. YR651]SDC89661.1 two component transcriptional regulator, LuxR family [Cupriavidus sp. YR651]